MLDCCISIVDAVEIPQSYSKPLIYCLSSLNTLRPRQNGCLFPDDIFKYFFLNENIWKSNKISLTFVPKGQINNILALIQIIAWRPPGDKPLSETMMVSLLTNICVTWPQWVKSIIIMFYSLCSSLLWSRTVASLSHSMLVTTTEWKQLRMGVAARSLFGSQKIGTSKNKPWNVLWKPWKKNPENPKVQRIRKQNSRMINRV